MAVNAKFDPAKMSDMSDYDPANPAISTGDTIKIAVVAAFSRPGALGGEVSFFAIQWVAHDINKRGGILVDGKKKLVQVIKADNQMLPDVTKKVTERMIVQERAHVIVGPGGSHLASPILMPFRERCNEIGMRQGSERFRGWRARAVTGC